MGPEEGGSVGESEQEGRRGRAGRPGKAAERRYRTSNIALWVQAVTFGNLKPEKLYV